MSSRTRTLEKIVKQYKFTIIDTCALFLDNPKTVDYSDLDYEGKIGLNRRKIESAIFYRSFLENGGSFYITSGISREYYNGNFLYKKQIKKRGGCIPPEEMALLRINRERSKEKKRLISLLIQKDKIVNLDERQKQTHQYFAQQYGYFREKYGLSEVDLDLLVSGLTLSKEHPSSIISNDYGILSAWRSVMLNEGTSRQDFGFFTRHRTNLFKVIRP